MKYIILILLISSCGRKICKGGQLYRCDKDKVCQPVHRDMANTKTVKCIIGDYK